MKNSKDKHQDYMQQRAQDKYDGNVEKGFPLKEFRKCVDYLAGVLGKVEFNDEDLSDITRMALSSRTKEASA
jgi:hypothetical protein